jgi:hypothetical protein
MNPKQILVYSAFNQLKKHMEDQRLIEFRAAFSKQMGSTVPTTKETREKPDITVKYAFGEYGETWDTKDTFSASFWKPNPR